LWPTEVRHQKSGVFRTRIRLTHDGRLYRVEIRSRKGGNFYAMVNDRVAKGANRREALLRLVELL
jgi:hypothetical protein